MSRSWGVMALCGLLPAACLGERNAEPEGTSTRVLVVGTVHSQHRRNPNYTYEHVVRILDAYDPDAVCVEIRPQEFRKEPYLKEMMLATVWGVAHGKHVCGFDWYDGSAREIRARLEQEPEYVAKARTLDSLVAANPITGPFEEEHGDYWGGNMDYRFYNGLAYNRYFEERYRLSLAVYGDSPINLNYESRNRRMMDLAWEAIRQHPGGKVVLLTGSEHKHYFDRDLAGRPGVAVVDLESLLPLADGPLDPAARAFLEDGDELPYYQDGYPLDTNRYYRGRMTELVHGPDMDWRPDIISQRNIEVAGRVIARWQAAQPASYRMTFDEAWVLFLSDECETAVDRLETLTTAVRGGLVEDWFVQAYSYRNLGLCYDLLGNRQGALRAYAEARRLAEPTRPERQIGLMLRDFETVPYQRGRAREPWRP